MVGLSQCSMQLSILNLTTTIHSLQYMYYADNIQSKSGMFVIDLSSLFIMNYSLVGLLK
jgi:hypothetical protein